MGSGRWSTDVYSLREEMRKRSGKSAFDYSASTTSDPFGPRVHPTLNPRGVNIRESRDSDEHPESLAIAVFFDVTGSMLNIPVTLQKKLPELLGLLLRKGYVDHPQILFGAIGDATCDKVPLQVGQFESDNRMDEQLEHIVLEGGGGGQKTESYELAMYFMAEHTAIDCWEKRGHKGYLFLIGDEMAYPAVKRTYVKGLIDDDIESDIPISAMIARLRERYEVFYILPQSASHGGDREVLTFWRKLLGQNVLELENEAAVCETIALTIGIWEGRTDLEEGVDHLKDIGVTDATVLGSVSKALAKLPGSAVVASTGNGLGGLSPADSSGAPPPTIKRL
ncbi:MAG TPA: hypothetical protein VKT82_04790 [Ktedonobacterales bacterium]|nr:hypothetical protein [Ktedonobacterales bacterium]